jgi:hypothetical protein
MAKLTTPAQDAKIEQGHKDTMDTYANTPIIIRTLVDISMDPLNEDRSDRAATDYSILAQVEYKSGSTSKEDVNQAGKWDNADIRVLIHKDNATAAGFMVNDYPTINSTTDLIIVDNGISTETFRINHVSIGGARFKDQTYVELKGLRDEQPESKWNL